MELSKRIDATAPPKAVVEAIRDHPVPEVLYFAWLKALVGKFDVIFLVTGPEGTGKSTLAEHHARILDKRFGLGDVATNPIQYLKLLGDSSSFEAKLFDESGSGLHNRRSGTKETMTLNEVFMEARILHLWQFLCFPRFESVDLYTRKWRARVWLRALRPGLAEVRIRDWEVPMVDETNPLDAYKKALTLTYPPMPSDYWAKREGKKERDLRRKISTAIEDLTS